MTTPTTPAGIADATQLLSGITDRLELLLTDVDALVKRIDLHQQGVQELLHSLKRGRGLAGSVIHGSSPLSVNSHSEGNGPDPSPSGDSGSGSTGESA